MKCESCNNEVPVDNIGRVCAYQIDDVLDHTGTITCNCCDECRNKCHEGLFENQKEDK